MSHARDGSGDSRLPLHTEVKLEHRDCAIANGENDMIRLGDSKVHDQSLLFILVQELVAASESLFTGRQVKLAQGAFRGGHQDSWVALVALLNDLHALDLVDLLLLLLCKLHSGRGLVWQRRDLVGTWQGQACPDFRDFIGLFGLESYDLVQVPQFHTAIFSTGRHQVPMRAQRAHILPDVPPESCDLLMAIVCDGPNLTCGVFTDAR